MDTERQATATPWEYRGLHIHSANGQVFARLAVVENRQHGEGQANAALIVAAVNERPALLARCAELERALKAAADELDRFGSLSGDADMGREWNGGTQSIIKAARAALAGGGKVGA